MKSENIAAISTPPGRGGVAVIRLSGESPLAAAEKMFTPAGKTEVAAFEPYRMYPGHIGCGGFSDFGLCVYLFAGKLRNAKTPSRTYCIKKLPILSIGQKSHMVSAQGTRVFPPLERIRAESNASLVHAKNKKTPAHEESAPLRDAFFFYTIQKSIQPFRKREGALFCPPRHKRAGRRLLDVYRPPEIEYIRRRT